VSGEDSAGLDREGPGAFGGTYPIGNGGAMKVDRFAGAERGGRERSD
jgi:hypothetical protein